MKSQAAIIQDCYHQSYPGFLESIDKSSLFFRAHVRKSASLNDTVVLWIDSVRGYNSEINKFQKDQNSLIVITKLPYEPESLKHLTILLQVKAHELSPNSNRIVLPDEERLLIESGNNFKGAFTAPIISSGNWNFIEISQQWLSNHILNKEYEENENLEELFHETEKFTIEQNRMIPEKFYHLNDSINPIIRGNTYASPPLTTAGGDKSFQFRASYHIQNDTLIENSQVSGKNNNTSTSYYPLGPNQWARGLVDLYSGSAIIGFSEIVFKSQCIAIHPNKWFDGHMYVQICQFDTVTNYCKLRLIKLADSCITESHEMSYRINYSNTIEDRYYLSPVEDTDKLTDKSIYWNSYLFYRKYAVLQKFNNSMVLKPQ